VIIDQCFLSAAPMRFEIAYRDYSLKRSASRLLSGAQAPRLINPGAPGVSLNPSSRRAGISLFYLSPPAPTPRPKSLLTP